MKNHFLTLIIAAMTFVGCNNNSGLYGLLTDFDSRITTLEILCQEFNTNITSLQIIVEAQQSGDYITGITPVMKDGKQVGYTITFANHEPITIYNGENGAKGDKGDKGDNGSATGTSPIVGVAQDTDGKYYWTLNGEWLLNDAGQKIPVIGEKGDKGEKGDAGATGAAGQDGQNGTNGTNGTNGQDGQDGITPQLKIESDYWYISYDNGATWTQLGKATGADGAKGDKGDKGDKGATGATGPAGADGQDGDSMFQSVTQDENNVYFTLADGTVITIKKGGNSSSESHEPTDIIEFKDLAVKRQLLTKYNIDINLDGEITYAEATSYNGRIEISGVQSFKELQYFTGVSYISFNSSTNLFEFTLPESLDSIGDACFKGCKLLKKIDLPSSCTYIGNQAFQECVLLNNIHINASVRNIGDKAFYGCTSLTNITFDEGCLQIGAEAFRDCAMTSVDFLPSTVTSIGDGAFIMSSLTSFSFPIGLKSGGFALYIGDGSGNYCAKNVKEINWNCESYTDAILKNQNYIVEGVCCYCYWSSSSTYYRIDQVESLIIGNSVQIIPEYCFAFMRRITTLDIPSSVISIGASAFWGCSALTTVKVRATTPPSLGGSALPTTVNIIYVPNSSVSAYKILWAAYADKIIGIDF